MPLGLTPGIGPPDLWPLALVFVGIALYVAIGALSHERDRAWSAAVIYLGLGLVAAVALEALGTPPLDPLKGERIIERLTEVTIVLAVFTSGLSIERLVSLRQWRSVGMLLLVVMPATIALVALFGTLVMGLSLAAALCLGAILAPTDPVLAGDVGLRPPGELEHARDPQFSLHTEAGLNDGLAAPFVLAGVLLAEEGGTGWIAGWLGLDVVYGIVVAALAGAVAGYAIAGGTVRLRDRGLLSREFDAFVALASCLLVYGAIEAVSAYGFVAVFFAGFAFRRYDFEHEVSRKVHDGADEYSKLLELGVLLLLGSLVTFEGLGEPGLGGWLLAPLLIFVIRPAVVLPLAAGSLLGWGQRLFIAWFGVRGVAALFYVAYVIETEALSRAETTKVFWTTVVVVMVSVLIHGMSASPLTRRLLGDPA